MSRRQNGVQWRFIEAQGRGVVGPRGDENGTARLHVIDDIVEIDGRENAAPLVPVEDHEIELAELLDEEFAGRKGDEGKFLDRCAVLFFGRPQNGEMNEIDGRIGLEQIAPGAFARMRLPKRAALQAVANAFGGDDGAIVLKRNLVFEGGDRHFSVIATPMLNIDGDLDGLAGPRSERGGTAVIIGYSHLDGCCRCARSLIVDAEREVLLLADDAETRRPLDHQTAVGSVAGAGYQGVQWAVVAECAQAFGRVMNLAVGDHDGAGIALRRNVGQDGIQGFEGARALLLLAFGRLHGDGTDLRLTQFRDGV